MTRVLQEKKNDPANKKKMQGRLDDIQGKLKEIQKDDGTQVGTLNLTGTHAAALSSLYAQRTKWCFVERETT